jgi:hypothetical protein
MSVIVPRDLVLPDKRVKLNGEYLEHYGLWLHKNGVQVGAVSPSARYRTIPGRGGSIDVSLVDYASRPFEGRRTVVVTVGSVGSESEYRDSVLALGALKGQIVTLQDELYPGYWYGRLEVGEWDITRNGFGQFIMASVKLSLDAHPNMLSDLRKVTIPNNGTPTVNIGGNRGALPVFNAKTVGGTTAISVSAKMLSNTVADRKLTVNSPSGIAFPADLNLVIDMAAGTVTMNSNPVYSMDISTDFWELRPGAQQIIMNGLGGDMVYREEWGM